MKNNFLLIIGILFFFSSIYGEEIVEKQEIYLSGKTLIPGLYQICQEKQLVKGIVLMGTEIAFLTTGMMTYSKSEKLYKEYSDAKKVLSVEEWDKKWNDYEKSFKMMQKLFVLAGSIYVINFIDALVHFKKTTITYKQNFENKVIFDYNFNKIKIAYKQGF